MVKVRTTCRVCESPLIPILDLGVQRLTGWTKTPDEPGPEGPLSLVRCTNKPCSLVQLEHTMDADLMWRDADYGYRSSLNPIMIDALANLVKSSRRKVDLVDDDIVVDIGSNDGTLLRNYPPNITTVGYEPVKKLEKKGAEGIDCLISDYFSAQDYPFLQKAKAITAVAMFYDLEDPNQFVEDVYEVLDDDGVFVIQLNYLPIILLQNDFLCVCHEHLEYYTIQSIEYLLNLHGLYAFDAEINEINGGSLRLYVAKGTKRSESFMLYVLRKWEERLLLDTDEPYKEFVNNVMEIREDLIDIVHDANSEGKKVFGYASSTKGNVLLQFCGFGPDDIQSVSEKNPDKWGRYCAGSGIPVISEDEARSRNPDYFLVLAWAFMDEFRRREKNWHNSGGQFILPVPEVTVE